jgi:hypothetical protein
MRTLALILCTAAAVSIYAIPSQTLQGHTDALGQKVQTVRAAFRTRNQEVAGGVFGVRTEPGPP